jgi:hypothetical protein
MHSETLANSLHGLVDGDVIDAWDVAAATAFIEA